MWLIPTQYRLQLALLLVTLIFSIYGANELKEAMTYDTSAHDGLEALVFAAVSFALFVAVTWWKQRRSAR